MIHDVHKHDCTAFPTPELKRVQDLQVHVFSLILSKKLFKSI